MRERLIGGWEWFYKKERGGSALVTWRSWRAMQAALVAILYLLTTIAEAQVLKPDKVHLCETEIERCKV